MIFASRKNREAFALSLQFAKVHFNGSHGQLKMQRYKILHRTYYNFAGLVNLGLHHLRLRPRTDYDLRVESSNLKIYPPATLLWYRDVEGNSVAAASFEEATTQLSIESEVVVHQYNLDPLDFLVADYAVAYPFLYQQEDLVLLSPYREMLNPEIQETLSEWLKNIWQPGQSIQTYTLLQKINTYIHDHLTYRLREEPGVQSAGQTLSLGTGSCRDFAMLFMEICRYLGLASRFVSGYLHCPPSTAGYGSTHAWAEVYLPGAGWKGFDPTIGAMAGAEHIAVAVARLPENVPPVEGTFVGVPGSTLEVGVWVTKF